MLCQFIDPSWEIEPHWEIWREEIVVQALRALGQCAHDEQSSKMVMQVWPSSHTHITFHLVEGTRMTTRWAFFFIHSSFLPD